MAAVTPRMNAGATGVICSRRTSRSHQQGPPAQPVPAHTNPLVSHHLRLLHVGVRWRLAAGAPVVHVRIVLARLRSLTRECFCFEFNKQSWLKADLREVDEIFCRMFFF